MIIDDTFPRTIDIISVESVYDSSIKENLPLETYLHVLILHKLLEIFTWRIIAYSRRDVERRFTVTCE